MLVPLGKLPVPVPPLNPPYVPPSAANIEGTLLYPPALELLAIPINQNAPPPVVTVTSK
jgi:hypothetical protein